MHFYRYLIAGVVTWSLCANPGMTQEETFTEPKSQNVFPTKIEFEHTGKTHNLSLTGAFQLQRQTQTGSMIQLYTMAHYSEDFASDLTKTAYEVISELNFAKQMTFEFDREFSAEHTQKSYQKLFDKMMAKAEQEEMKDAIATFIGCFIKDIKEGERFSIRWLPGDTVIVFLPDGTQKEIKKPGFGALLWKSWFGLDSQVDRAALLERKS